VLVVPHGDRYVISSAPGGRSETAVDDVLALFRSMAIGSAPPAVAATGAAGDPKRAELVCGFLGCDARPYNPLLESLPRLVHLRARQSAGSKRIGQLVDYALAESLPLRRGSRCVLLRLSELLFVEALRLHLETLPDEHTGWLAGLRDPVAGRALALIHERPAHAWTLAGLAAEGGVSRSVLAGRFAHRVGRPPMRYLAHWRMQLAARLLTDGSAKVSAVALQVGYDSEAAFSRAFKKIVAFRPRAGGCALTRRIPPAHGGDWHIRETRQGRLTAAGAPGGRRRRRCAALRVAAGTHVRAGARRNDGKADPVRRTGRVRLDAVDVRLR
jgi:AraC-like DNA-binding protein